MKINQKLLRTMAIVAGGLIICILIIALISGCNSGKKFTISDLENKLITLTKKYYQANEGSLPSEGKSTTVSAQHFVENKKIKSLKIKSGEECYGEIIVSNNNGYYLYIPKLTCGTNTPITLSKKITSNENTVITGNGLYKYNNSYIFRGDTLNNNITFANRNWKIIRINEDGTIRVMDTTKRESATWDNRYNIDRSTTSGINDYISNDINSRIKDTLDDIYISEKEFSDDDRAHFVKHDLCVGKRNEAETVMDGSVECAQIVEDQIFGLIQANEYLLASLDQNCTDTTNASCINYNYLSTFTGSTWTITANSENSYKVYKIFSGLNSSMTSGSGGVKIVAHLNKDILFSEGDGSEETPYIIK